MGKGDEKLLPQTGYTDEQEVYTECSLLLTLRDAQVKVIVRYSLTLVRVLYIKKR